ncbi:MAG: hypothetical protein QME21_02590, partial [Anaerolineales bacterium]|nr:hypothetical protein [Anaerolineales bacterium]
MKKLTVASWVFGNPSLRHFLIISALSILIVMVSIIGFGVALASEGALYPGDPFFPLQYLAEQAEGVLLLNSTDKAYYLLSLTERRIRNVESVAATKYEPLALEYFNRSLDQALRALQNVPEEDEPFARRALLGILGQAQQMLNTLVVAPRLTADLFTALQAKVSTLIALLGDPTARLGDILPLLTAKSPPVTAVAGSDLDSRLEIIARQLQQPAMVAFPAGSLGALHPFFPLTGRHAELECAACHANGQYRGTPRMCEGCHAADKPPRHFDGDCASCHTAQSWREVHFDHSVVSNQSCIACHTKDKPANHFSGECSACHSTSAWLPANFNHGVAGAVDCLSCHTSDRPPDHFAGQCSQCHNTNAWLPASFDHAAIGAVDCLSCHTDDRPPNHFAGQCSQCHSTGGWLPASFNHAAAGAVDCLSCHTRDKPANHFAGQCSQCHNTRAWLPATFDHAAAGATDCQSCHASDRPANHFAGQCSQCHNTISWSGATFNHTGAVDCQSCHASDRPANHFTGQCSQCHNTTSWRGATFNH